MIWQDLLFDRLVDDRDLLHAVAEVFAVPPRAVRIVDHITPEPAETDRDIRVQVERFAAPGDFPLHTSIYLLDEELARRAEPTDEAVTLDDVALERDEYRVMSSVPVGTRSHTA